MKDEFGFVLIKKITFTQMLAGLGVVLYGPEVLG